MRLRHGTPGIALVCAGLTAPTASAKSVPNLSLKELMNIQVAPVSRKAQRLKDSAAAAFVITTGFELQAKVRLLWTTDAVNNSWTALSRASRIPLRGELDLGEYKGDIPSYSNGL